MVLQHSNFEIVASLRFRPFEATWMVRRAEILDWALIPENSSLLRGMNAPPEPLKEGLSISIELPMGLAQMLLNEPPSSYVFEIDREYVSSDVLRKDETPRNAPNIAGRTFDVLVCHKPEMSQRFSSLKPGSKYKNARLMLYDFLNETSDAYSLRDFLNRWGIWRWGSGYYEQPLASGGIKWPPSVFVRLEERPSPPFLLEFPHFLSQERERYKKALLPSNARRWLKSSGGLSLSNIDTPPYFIVNRSYCDQTVETIITIQHLTGAKFGICKRCRRSFEHQFEHKKIYCSRSCSSAAAVKKYRDSKRKSLNQRSGNATRKD
jgi:hypothetical protein